MVQHSLDDLGGGEGLHAGFGAWQPGFEVVHPGSGAVYPVVFGVIANFTLA